MSPITPPQIQMKPGNDVLTAMLGAAIVVQIITLVVLYIRGTTLGYSFF